MKLLQKYLINNYIIQSLRDLIINNNILIRDFLPIYFENSNRRLRSCFRRWSGRRWWNKMRNIVSHMIKLANTFMTCQRVKFSVALLALKRTFNFFSNQNFIFTLAKIVHTHKNIRSIVIIRGRSCSMICGISCSMICGWCISGDPISWRHFLNFFLNIFKNTVFLS